MVPVKEEDLIALNADQPNIDRWELKHSQGSRTTNNWHLELVQDVLNDHIQGPSYDFEVQVGTIDVELAPARSKPRVSVWVQCNNASAVTRHVANNHSSALRNEDDALLSLTILALRSDQG